MSKDIRKENDTHTPPKKAGRPGTSSRQAILQAAQELLLEGGEKALSFRKLGTKLGITAPSIYSYFANKQAMMAALSSYALDISDIKTNAKDTPREQLKQLLSATRDLLLRNTHLLHLFYTTLPAQQMVEVVEAFAAPIIRAGYTEEIAVRHAQSLVWMLLSFALFETTAKDTAIIEQFLQVDDKLSETIKHLNLTNHENLWQETLQRNLDGLF